jgi:hypothetical protein
MHENGFCLGRAASRAVSATFLTWRNWAIISAVTSKFICTVRELHFRAYVFNAVPEVEQGVTPIKANKSQKENLDCVGIVER